MTTMSTNPTSSWQAKISTATIGSTNLKGQDLTDLTSKINEFVQSTFFRKYLETNYKSDTSIQISLKLINGKLTIEHQPNPNATAFDPDSDESTKKIIESVTKIAKSYMTATKEEPKPPPLTPSSSAITKQPSATPPVVKSPVKKPTQIAPATKSPNVKGIKNKGGNDCFLNALCQFLKAPTLQQHLVDKLPKELKTLFNAETIDSTALRTALVNNTSFGKTEKATEGQHDPTEVFSALWQRVGHLNNSYSKTATPKDSPDIKTNPLNTEITTKKTFSLQGNDQHTILEKVPSPTIECAMTANQPVDFMQVFTSYFNEPPNKDEYVIHSEKQFYLSKKEVKFTSIPKTLCLSFKRYQFDSATKKTTKIKTDISGIEKSFILPKDLLDTQLQGKTLEYELKSFIVHEGNTPASGHYITYRKENNVWYKLNDDIECKTITETAALDAAKQTCFSCYELV